MKTLATIIVSRLADALGYSLVPAACRDEALEQAVVMIRTGYDEVTINYPDCVVIVTREETVKRNNVVTLRSVKCGKDTRAE